MQDLRKMIFPKVLKFSNHELNQISKSSLITRTLIDVSQIQMFAEEFFTVIIFAPIIGVGGILKSFELGTDLSGIIVLIVVIVVIFMIPLFKKVMPYLGKIQEITDGINRNINETLIGMPVIKTFVRQDYEEEKFDKTNSEYNQINVRAYRYALLLTPLLTLHLSLMTVGIIYFGSFQIERGSLLIGDLLAFIQYATQIVTSFLMVATFFTIMPDVIVSIRRVNEIFKTEVSITDGELETINTDQPSIEFRNVDFKYPNSQNNTLTDINLKLEGEKPLQS